MKKITQNKIVKYLNNLFQVQKSLLFSTSYLNSPTHKVKLLVVKENEKMFKTINYNFSFLIVILVLFSFNLQAQNFVEFNSYLGQSLSSNNVSTVKDAKYLKSLIVDLNASVIIKNGAITTYSNAPFLTVDVDANSKNNLYEANLLFNDAELIIIRIDKPEDLALSIDSNKLNHFSKLKYIYVLCSFKTTSAQINNLIISKNSNIKYFYLISIPS